MFVRTFLRIQGRIHIYSAVLRHLLYDQNLEKAVLLAVPDIAYKEESHE